MQLQQEPMLKLQIGKRGVFKSPLIINKKALIIEYKHRDWESDGVIRSVGQNSEKCDDIAEQLILSETGKKINVSVAKVFMLMQL